MPATIHRLKIDPSVESGKVQLARQRLQKTLHNFLKEAGEKAAAAVRKRAKKVSKADDEDEIKYYANAAYEAIEWKHVVDEVQDDLEEAYADGGLTGLLQLEVSDQDMISAVNELAVKFAEDRAAEMVGMKWVDGKLVENPNAEWAISETTRDDLRDLIESAFSDETPIEQLAADIQEAGTFSEARAEMIARTETSRAQIEGNLEAWKDTGVVLSVDVVLSGDHDLEDECDEVADGGPYDIGDAPDLPIHPNCYCSLVANEIVEP